MKIKFSAKFIEKFERQIRYIAKDKPIAAKKFRKELREKIISIPQSLNSYRKSPDFPNIEVRELIYKGYTIRFKIDRTDNIILLFSFTQWDEPEPLSDDE